MHNEVGLGGDPELPKEPADTLRLRWDPTEKTLLSCAWTMDPRKLGGIVLF